ncbi:MAG: amidohydrolase, partial [Acidimicrobiia bacterium]|nr:amidohydrolase [Acidimicrobiia bacterium]
MAATTGDNYTVISADCHGGADIGAYRPYLESRYHDEFDAWSATFVNPYEDIVGADASRNWDSDRRLREMEADGVVAEV